MPASQTVLHAFVDAVVARDFVRAQAQRILRSTSGA
jgi:hypothetical protein